MEEVIQIAFTSLQIQASTSDSIQSKHRLNGDIEHTLEIIFLLWSTPIRSMLDTYQDLFSFSLPRKPKIVVTNSFVIRTQTSKSVR